MKYATEAEALRALSGSDDYAASAFTSESGRPTVVRLVKIAASKDIEVLLDDGGESIARMTLRDAICEQDGLLREAVMTALRDAVPTRIAANLREISSELRERIAAHLVDLDAGSDGARELLVDVADAIGVAFRHSPKSD